jgi:hypothetical protein
MEGMRNLKKEFYSRYLKGRVFAYVLDSTGSV